MDITALLVSWLPRVLGTARLDFECTWEMIEIGFYILQRVCILYFNFNLVHERNIRSRWARQKIK